MTIFTKIGSWLKTTFNNIKNDVDKVAIAITEGVKVALDSGVLPIIADLIPGTAPKEVISLLQVWVPKILALELGLQGLPDNASIAQIEAFTNQVIAAVASKSTLNKSQLWTTLSSQIFNLIEAEINANPNHGLSFAQIVSIVESAYIDYQNDLATEPASTTTTSSTTK